MKSAINQWFFPEGTTVEQAFKAARQVGFEAFEICVGPSGPLPLTMSESDAHAIRRAADEVGIELTSVASGVGWEWPFTSPDPSLREKGKEAVAQSMQIAHWLGANTVLAVPGLVTSEVPYDTALENAWTCIQDLVPVAEKLRVSIGIENVWNKFLLSPVEMRDFIDQFQSEYVGAYFDIGNVITTGFPEQWISILGKRIRKIHAKDYRASTGTFDGFVMLLEGSVNWPAVMAALRSTGYDGALIAESGPYTYSVDAALRHLFVSLEAIKKL